MSAFDITELIEDEVRKVEIHRSTEEGNPKKNGNLTRTMDKIFDTDVGNCYVTVGDINSVWASFEMAWSLVTHVDILTIETADTKRFIRKLLLLNSSIKSAAKRAQKNYDITSKIRKQNKILCIRI